MREYASTTLNVIEYAGIYLKKQRAEYARILNVSDAVYSIRSLYKFKMKRYTKRIMPECRCATRNGEGKVFETRALR